MKQRMQRGGSIVGFIIACIIGAVILVGGVYTLRHVGWFDQTNSDGTSKVATTSEKQSGEKSPDQHSTKKETSKSSDQKATKTHKSDKKTTKKSSKTIAPEKSKTAEKPSTHHKTTSNTSDTTAIDQTPAVDLPHTGPADVLASVLGIGFLTAAILAYERSRHLA